MVTRKIILAQSEADTQNTLVQGIGYSNGSDIANNSVNYNINMSNNNQPIPSHLFPLLKLFLLL